MCGRGSEEPHTNGGIWTKNYSAAIVYGLFTCIHARKLQQTALPFHVQRRLLSTTRWPAFTLFSVSV